MSRRVMLLAAVPLVLAAAVAVLWAQEPGRAAPAGVFAALRPGQSVALREVGSAYHLTTFVQEVQGPFKVMELGADYIVLQDVVGFQEHRIPIYAVRGVTHVRR